MSESHMPESTHPYLSKPILEWLRERADGSLAGMKFREAADEIERLVEREKSWFRAEAEFYGLTPEQVPGVGTSFADRRSAVEALVLENARLRNALRYWLPDETMIPAGHEVAWNEHVALIPEHRRTDSIPAGTEP